MPKAEKEEKEKVKEGKATEKAPAKEEAAKTPAKEPKGAEEVKEAKKPAKGKIQKKKRIEKKIHTIYKIEGESVTRLRPFCERCGPGYFMADHGNRFACGHCGFTRYKVTGPA